LQELDPNDASEEETMQLKITYTIDVSVFTAIVAVGSMRAIAAVVVV
jgi:hypothetical protein